MDLAEGYGVEPLTFRSATVFEAACTHRAQPSVLRSEVRQALTPRGMILDIAVGYIVIDNAIDAG